MNTTKPIWKDYVEYSSSDGEYRIYDENTNELIYTGTATVMPYMDEAELYINDVVRGKMNSAINLFPTTGYTGIVRQYILPIRIEMPDGETYYTKFRNDYSYQNALPLSNTNCISHPINNKLHPKQLFICSWFNDDEVENVNLNIAGVNRAIYANILNAGLNYTMGLSNYNFANRNDITLEFTGDTIQYRVMDCTNSNYVLYYKNAYGGWDSFVIEGNVVRSDKISNSSYRKFYLNNRIKGNKQSANLVNYLTTIQPSYTMYTHYMRDEESLRMHHLLESNEVYLHIIDEDMIYPILITDKTVDYQSYTNNGKKMVQYVIHAETSQREFRR